MAVSRLDELSSLRACFDQICLKLGGKRATAKTVACKWAVFFNALEYAVEVKALHKNRLREVKWIAPKTVCAIDRRAVINHRQARQLLVAVGEQEAERQLRRSAGRALVTLFGVMYDAALRPEEAGMLNKRALNLSDTGWGALLISQTAPIVGAAWTDSGDRRDRRQLKQRGRGEVRPAPSPPQLTRLLHAHV